MKGNNNNHCFSLTVERMENIKILRGRSTTQADLLQGGSQDHLVLLLALLNTHEGEDTLLLE